jgi:hypothetical protein
MSTQKPKIEDRVYRSQAGFFHVWKLTNSYGIYNNNGVRVASVPRNQYVDDARTLEFAKLAADAFETRFQW